VLKNQYLRPENLKKWQKKRLRYIVEHALRNTRFYKEKFRKAGITYDDIQQVSDVHKLPLTTKEEVVQAGNAIRAAGYDETNCEVHYTSGSSGSMLKILYDHESHSYETALTYRYHLSQGVRPWHRYLLILHDEIELQDAKRGSILYRSFGVSGDTPDEEKVEYAQWVRPHVMGGHLSSFVPMAKMVEEKRITTVRPKIIIIGGELSFPPYREYVEKIFHGATYDKYGAFEVKSIAWECRHRNMHMDADSVLCEVIRDGEPAGPGERGEVVVTNLWNKAMPFIRYKLGDIGVVSDEVCTCGRTLPLMDVVEGRLDDFIVLPSGRIIPPGAVVPLFFNLPHIEQFKVIQYKKDAVTVTIVPGQQYSDAVEKPLVHRLETVFGEPVYITVEKVETIEQKARGKYRAVISQVELDLSSL
jgi:phenylacetate-CoA ligase